MSALHIDSDVPSPPSFGVSPTPLSGPRHIDCGMTLARASRLYGLSVRALRFYEERGLLAPRRDARNHRVFDNAQVRRLNLIAILRRADVPINTIAHLIAQEPATFARELRTALSHRMSVIARKQAALREAFHLLDAATEPTSPLSRG